MTPRKQLVNHPRSKARDKTRTVKPQGTLPPPKSGIPVKKPWSTWLLLLLALVITTLAMQPSLDNEFIETWDDGVYVTDNTTITEFSRENIHAMFTTSVNGTYVPIPLLSLALEYHFFKLNPKPYHINNLLLHLLCTALVFYLLLLLQIKPVFAVFGALLFGIHPMRVESVAWVTERKDLLFSLFYLLALVSYVYQITREKKKYRYYFLTLLFFLLSLFSKIQAVSLPLSLLLLDYFFRRPLQLKLIWEKIPHFALSLVFGLAGIFVLERTGSLEINEAYSLGERILFGLHSLLTYLYKLFYPVPLSVYYPYPMSPGKAIPWIYYASPAILLAITTILFLLRRQARVLVFGSLFFLVNIMFLLQILGAGQAFMADRFTYIPYLGLFLAAVWGLQTLTEKKKFPLALIIVVMAGITLVFSSMTFKRSEQWKNSETIWTDVINKYPGKIPTAYANRASYLRKTDRWEQALADYNKAIRLDPKNASSVMNRGNLFFDLGKLDSAYVDYINALKIKKKTMELDRLYANFGAVYGKRQQFDSALYYINLSMQLNDKFPPAYLNRALIYENTGENELAVKDYTKYLTFRPEDDRVYSSIGVSYQKMKQHEMAVEWFSKGIEANPRSGLHYNNRAYSYNALGNKEKAKQDLQRAIDLGYAIKEDFAKFLGIQ